ncbi:peptide chain release factor N(5)-glutamine methyltransferase [bacterium]|nr:peptide chain release factor N(5)-glutamine methyltransferase [bacterium]MBU1883597.1 peptide chain release factor N(5)-glutamine methyltransferase [bacterium]
MPEYRLENLQKELVSILNGKIERAAREAQLILMHSLDCDELWLMMHKEEVIQNADEIIKKAHRRSKNEPLEYITNSVSFYSQEFFIDYGALIPRPETELLIDEVLNRIDDKNSALTFTEVGVGSGIISIVLAQHLPNAKFIAVDISENALKIARENIKRFGLEDRIELRHGSLLEPVGEKIDFLVSNPPYIANDAPLETNLSYEPQNALFGGEIGDEIIQELLIEFLSRDINWFCCEMGYDQRDKIVNFLNNKNFEKLDFYKDLSGFDRGFTLKARDE